MCFHTYNYLYLESKDYDIYFETGYILRYCVSQQG